MSDAAPIDGIHDTVRSRVGTVSETIDLMETQSAKTPLAPLRWRGWLAPVLTETELEDAVEQTRIELSSSVFNIGRVPQSDCVLSSPSVSRAHARIHRRETEFYIEDLGSLHGTFVNGDRVLWCRLADGDVLQFGHNEPENRRLFTREAVRQKTQPVLANISQQRRPEQTPHDQMVITFWGCRGSIPTPGSHTEIYGGNTTCLEVRYGDTLFILDAGTGIRSLGAAWEAEFSEATLDIHLLLSHLHWDHIQGFPFLKQAYDPRNRMEIIGVDHGTGTVQEMLRNQMQGLYFPIPMEAMQANMTFTNLGDEIEVGDVRISKMALPHPGGSHAYKFSVPSGNFVFATDCELNALCSNIQSIEPTATSGRKFPVELIDFFRDVDLLVLDCQYTDAQYQQRVGWGHNSVSTVIDVCRQAQVRAVALTHHDPASSDAEVHDTLDVAKRGLKGTMANGRTPRVFAAREGMMVVASSEW